MPLNSDDRAILKCTVIGFTVGCLAPCGLLALFIWACVAIFRWGFR